MLPLLRSEVFRARRRRSTWVLIGILAVLVIAVYGILHATILGQEQLIAQDPSQAEQLRASMEQLEEGLAMDQVPSLGLGLVNGIGLILLVIFAADVIGGEYEHGTLRTLLPRARGRPQLILAKLATIALFAAGLVVAGTTAALAGAALVGAIAGYPIALGDDFAGRLGAQAVIVWGVLLPYAALAFLVGLALRSSGAAIAVALVVYFVEGTAMGLLASLDPTLAAIGDWGLSRNVSALAALNSPTIDVGGQSVGAPGAMPSATHAVLVLAGYTIGFVVLALDRFQRRDLTLA